MKTNKSSMRYRKSFLFTVAVFSLVLVSCSRQSRPSDDTAAVTSDYSSMQSDRDAIHFVSLCARSEKAIYFTEKIDSQSTYSRIMYYDPGSGMCGPLCDKPECTHEDENCNAVFNWDIRAFAYYDGKLYFDLDSYLEKDSKPGRAIYCCDETGNHRKKLGHAGGEALLKSHESTQGVFHRGKVYYSGAYLEMKDGIPHQGVTVVSYDLENPAEEQVVYEEEFLENQSGDIRMQLIQDSLYCMVTTLRNPEAEDKEQTYTLGLYRLNIENGASETLWSGETDYIVCDFWVTDNGILLSSGKDGRIFRYDNAEGKIRLYKDLSELGSYTHAWFSDNLIFSFRMGKTESAMCILDFAGEVLYNGSREREDYEALRQILCSDQECLYVKYQSMEDPSKESLVSINLHSGERKILWTDSIF